MKITTSEIVEIIEPIYSNLGDWTIENYQYDSRAVSSKSLFIPLKGEKTDGSKYILSAVEKDPENISLCSAEYFNQNNDTLSKKNIIVVEDTLAAFQKLAKGILERRPRKIIGITGSNGKTTTKEMLYWVMKDKFRCDRTQGNHNSDIGLPYSVLNSSDDAEHLILEMGMNRVGEISTLVDIAPPYIALITNIGTSHIGILGSKENILKAKLEITEQMNESSTLIVNGNDPMLSNLQSTESGYNLIKTDHRYEDMHFDEIGRPTFIFNGVKMKMNIIGEHNAGNFLLVCEAARLLGLDTQYLASRIESFDAVDRRLSVSINATGVIILNDVYNASTDSMIKAIDTLKKVKCKRKIAVLGDMLEMGDESDRQHETVGTHITEIDYLMTYGEAARHISRKASLNGIDAKHYETKEELGNQLGVLLQEGDALLLKASRGMRFEDFLDYVGD